jgi:hypothetical protein
MDFGLCYWFDWTMKTIWGWGWELCEGVGEFCFFGGNACEGLGNGGLGDSGNGRCVTRLDHGVVRRRLRPVAHRREDLR